jgi:hypothetical protein
MTLWVGRDGQVITIHGNVGLNVKIQDSWVAEYSVSEHYAHLRHFWGQLGDALNEAEQAATAEVHEAEPGGF